MAATLPLSAQTASPQTRPPSPAPPAPDSPPSADVVTPQTRQAIEKGLDWLAANQAPDGHWGEQFPVATTSLAGLALLAGGHLPGRGKYGLKVLQAIRYLLKWARMKVDSSHYYFSEIGGQMQGGSRMHGHGYATLFLSEAYGMAEDFGSDVNPEELRVSIQCAVRTIENSQSSQGGWYYEPDLVPGRKVDADEGSVTVTQI